jgi:tritrans,polycis-undecaprenyl-diphosphate synthase [geranylgeranyl-diphosphate specific]
MSSHFPRHIAVILDGNRRWARKHHLPVWEGHRKGIARVKDLFKWCKELGIKEITLYAFSTENFKREKQEVDFLMDVFRRQFDELKKHEDVVKKKLRVHVAGRTWMFPKDLQKQMRRIMELTKENKEYRVNFALGYGGRQEITDAVKLIAAKVKANKLKADAITEDTITSNLYLESEPDLIIRPGGEKRVSNFLIWQGNYAEWFFLNKMWPEFTKNDLKKIVHEFSLRQRRFGE